MKWSKGKVLIAGCGGFFLLFLLWLSVIIYNLATAITAPLDPVAKHNYLTEQVSPILKGVIVTKKIVITPFSKDTAALCILRCGREMRYDSSKRFRNRTMSKWGYDDKMIVSEGQHAFIKIGSIEYPINFKDVILGLNKNGMRYGTPGTSFATDSYAKVDVLNRLHPDPVKEQIIIDSLNRIYFKNLKTLKQFYGRRYYLDQFIEKKMIKKQKYFYDHVIIHEILFNNNDSIAIKGKIENGKIITLY